MAVCGLSLHLSSSESCKTLEQNLSSKSALLIPTVSTSAFHSTNLFLFSRHHTPPKGQLHFLHINPHTTHNSSNRPDEGLTLETSALELFRVANIFNSVINTRLPGSRSSLVELLYLKQLINKACSYFVHYRFTIFFSFFNF